MRTYLTAKPIYECHRSAEYSDLSHDGPTLVISGNYRGGVLDPSKTNFEYRGDRNLVLFLPRLNYLKKVL